MSKKRSAKGAGSIYKDNSGHWVAQIQIGFYPNGRPKYKRFKALKQSDVVEKLNAFKLMPNHFMLFTGENEDAALEDYIKAYIETYKEHKLKPSSYARDVRTYRKIKEYIGHYMLSQLTPKIIQIQLVNKLVSD